MKNNLRLLSIKNKIKNNQKQLEKIKSQIMKDSENLFKLSCKEIFEKHKNFYSFSWTQYSPYWNDGDSCDFSAHTDYIYVNDEDKESDIYSLEIELKEAEQKEKKIKKLLGEVEKLSKKKSAESIDSEISNKKNEIEKLNNTNLQSVRERLDFLKDINNLLENIDQDTLETMFGEGKVVVTATSITTEHYEHD